MGLTNAEKQARWRGRREQYVKELERRVAELEGEIERLRNQLEEAKTAALEPPRPAAPEKDEDRLRNQKRPGKSWKTNPEMAAWGQKMRDELERSARAKEAAKAAEVAKLKDLKEAVRKAHPDHGGTREAFEAANKAYQDHKVWVKNVVDQDKRRAMKDQLPHLKERARACGGDIVFQHNGNVRLKYPDGKIENVSTLAAAISWLEAREGARAELKRRGLVT